MRFVSGVMIIIVIAYDKKTFKADNIHSITLILMTFRLNPHLTFMPFLIYTGYNKCTVEYALCSFKAINTNKQIESDLF